MSLGDGRLPGRGQHCIRGQETVAELALCLQVVNGDERKRHPERALAC